MSRTLIFGASGLIGAALARDLLARGLTVIVVARRFTASQSQAFPERETCDFVTFDVGALTKLLQRTRPDVIVNCTGVLQDGPGGDAEEVHAGFVARLLAAREACSQEALLVHLSIPGAQAEDRTGFSISKRKADALIAAQGRPWLILRPGFVIADAAYGGSALIRALAALPLRLPQEESEAPFQVTAIRDISATIVWAAQRWDAGARDFARCFDVMSATKTNVGAVIEGFRQHFGGPAPRIALPSPLLDLGAAVADQVARLGWRPPIRSTALTEMRRGVSGDPTPWRDATGLKASDLAQALAQIPATIQEKWFARLYLLKSLAIGGLALFWALSGLIALTAGFAAAKAVLTAHGLADSGAAIFVTATSIIDIAIGAAIARAATCRAGLLAALAVSLAYLCGATIVAPELWADPLGPLVKVVPCLLLTLVALALDDDRG